MKAPKLEEVASPDPFGDGAFPGWEPFLPHLVHPLKVAIVEALLWIGEPLSAVQFGKVFRGAGEGFLESNVRYHLSHLVEVGILERLSAPEQKRSREKSFYFAGGGTDGLSRR